MYTLVLVILYWGYGVSITNGQQYFTQEKCEAAGEQWVKEQSIRFGLHRVEAKFSCLSQ